MKEIIVERKHSKKSNFPWKLKIGNKIKTDENEIGNEFSKYFAAIGPSLAKKYPWSIDAVWMFFGKGQCYLSQSVFTNKQIESCLFFSENKQKLWCWWSKF